MIYNIDKVISVIEETRRFSSENQLDLFGDSEQQRQNIELFDIEEMPKSELLSMEKAATGMYLSGHPMNNYRAFADNPRFKPIMDICKRKISDGNRVSVVGILSEVKLKQLKNKNTIGYATLEDTLASVDVIIFSQNLAKYRPLLNEGSIVIVHGKVSEREESEPEIICESIEQVPQSYERTEETYKLYLKIDSMGSSQFDEVCNILSDYKGETSVIMVFADTNKRVMAPKRLNVTPGNILISKLNEILSEKNVKLVKK